VATFAWRKVYLVSLLMVGIALSAVTANYVYGRWQLQRHKSDLERAKRRISVSEVELSQVSGRSASQHGADAVAIEVVRGRVKNKSEKYELTSIQVLATVKDCVGSICEVVGQSDKEIVLSIPPRQSRDFRETFRFEPTLNDPQGKFVWSIHLKGACSDSESRYLPCADIGWSWR
jgi:hypothetical protein